MTDQTAAAERIAAIQQGVREFIDRESAVAAKHQSDVHFTTSRGHNLSNDERLALYYAGRMNLKPAPAETDDATAYLLRLLAELETLKNSFRAGEEDPEGFGIATLHGLTRALEEFR